MYTVNNQLLFATIVVDILVVVVITVAMQMVERLKQKVQELKDALTIATGEERTDELTAEERNKLVG